MAELILVATRKGAWLFHGDRARASWRVDGPHFHGHIISHLVLDPRDGRTLLAAAKTGHLGPTIFRSVDHGRSWKEATRPPAFAKAKNGAAGRAVDHTFWLTPGHATEAGVWYAGTSPQGLFRSEDGGATWAPFSGINDDPQYRAWMGTVQDGTPDGPKLHSILVDPRDARHLYFAMSSGGVHESVDGGRSFAPLSKGLAVVEGFDAADLTFHDPHCVRLCPSHPDRLYQQNHCGIYRLERPSDQWVRIGASMPKRVGDIGFPMVVHPRDADTAWVFPMDGTSVWPRTSPEGRPAVYATRNGGGTWRRLAAGMPRRQAWWTVKRQAMTADARNPVGLYFGTTSGELWMSRNEGARWRCIARHLPEIYAVEAADLAYGRVIFAAEPDWRSRSMKVMIPGPLRSYTESPWVEAGGATLGAVLDDLDRQYPGIRFRMVDEQQRIRRHVRMFLDGEQVFDLALALRRTDELVIVQALSGG